MKSNMILVSLYEKVVKTNHIDDVQNFVEASFDQYYDKVYFFARKRNPAYAKDIAQETFKRFQEALIKRLEMNFQEDEAVLQYLTVIARNLANTQYGKSKRFVQLEENLDSEKRIHPHQAVERQQKIDTMMRLVNDKEASMFKLQAAGYDYQEIAKKLNMKPAAVKQALYRCRKKLKPFRHDWQQKGLQF